MVEIEHLVGVAVMGAISVLGVYVRFSNELALAKLRIEHLEKEAADFDQRINSHDDKIQSILLDLKNDISELKLLIEKKMK